MDLGLHTLRILRVNGLDLLPPHLANRSIGDREIVLPMNEALEAIDTLEKRGVQILSWEGWIKSPDGSIGHGCAPQGTVSLDGLSVGEAAQLCRKTIFEDGERWIRDSSDCSEELYFRIIC